MNNSDITIDLSTNSIEVHQKNAEDWKVTLLDTGKDTFTGGRIKQAQKYLENERFMLTYGDGVSNIDISSLIKSHENSKAMVTLTTVQPEGKFGVLGIEENNRVSSFQEKPKDHEAWINAGFFVIEPEIFNYIENSDAIIFEQDVLRKLAANNQLNAYRHTGFWQPMDMLKDKLKLNTLWSENKAPWKIWD